MRFTTALRSALFGVIGLMGVSSCTPVLASELIDKVETNGMFFKDNIEVYAIDDPDIKGITCYVTTVVIPYSFEDPTDSSIACRQVGPLAGKPTNRESVFVNNKNVFFKVQNVRRKYDEARQVLVYTSYVIKSGGKNHAHSISVVPPVEQ